jgi:hypothetical protein
LRACSTTFHRGPSCPRFNRTASRNLRLIRFRVTLPPSAFGTAKPTRARACPSTARQTPAKKGPDARLPSS